MAHAPSQDDRRIELPSEKVAELFNWHGGQGSATYALASTGLHHKVSAEMIDSAINELRREAVKFRTWTGYEADLLAIEELIDQLEQAIAGEGRRDNPTCGCAHERAENPAEREGDRRFVVQYRVMSGKWAVLSEHREFNEARRLAEQQSSDGSTEVLIADADLGPDGDNIVWRSGGSQGHHRRDNPAREGRFTVENAGGEVVAGPFHSKEQAQEEMDEREQMNGPYYRIVEKHRSAPYSDEEWRKRRGNPAHFPADEAQHAGEMLAIAITSDGTLYPIRKAVEESLWKKWMSKKYDSKRAPLAFAFYIEEGAKLLAKENQRSGEDKRPWHDQYPAAVRRIAAEDVAESVESKFRVDRAVADADEETRATRSSAEGGIDYSAREENPVYPAIGPAPLRASNPVGEVVPLKLMQPRLGETEERQGNPTMEERMGETRIRDEKTLEYYRTMPIAQAAWWHVHAPQDVPDLVVDRLIEKGLAKGEESKRRVRGGDGERGGHISVVVTTAKGRALAKTWKGGEPHYLKSHGGRLDNPSQGDFPVGSKVYWDTLRGLVPVEIVFASPSEAEVRVTKTHDAWKKGSVHVAPLRHLVRKEWVTVKDGKYVVVEPIRKVGPREGNPVEAYETGKGRDLSKRRKHNPTSDTTVADTILQQMGGMRMVSVMVGAKNFVALENGVQFSVGSGAKSGINKVRVVLMPSDTYEVEFWKIRGTSMKKVSEWEDVYAEDLVKLFEKETGMYLSMKAGR